MRNKFLPAVALVAGLLTTTGSSAGPTLIYQFHTNEVTNTCGPYTDCDSWNALHRQRLDAMTIGIDRDEATVHYSLRVSPDYFGSGEYWVANTGVDQLQLPVFFELMPFSLPLASATFTGPNALGLTSATVDVTREGRYLFGSMDVYNPDNMLRMTTGKGDSYYPDWPEQTYPAEWTGIIGNEFFFHDLWFFTGEWRFSHAVGGGNEVPEPGSLVLMLAALLGMGAWGRRQRKH